MAVSGEYHGAGILLVEKTGSHYPCVAGSWISASAAAGMVVGGLAAFCISLPFTPAWGWRVPFLAGGLSCFIGLWFRNQLTETKIKTEQSLPLTNIFKYKKSLFFTMAMAAFTGVYVYIGNMYIVVFLKQYVQLPTHHATFFAIFGEIIVAFCIPLMAYVADITNPYRQYCRGLALIAVFSPCLFLLAASGNYLYISFAMLLYGVLNGIVCGPMVKILCDQFPPTIRYTGIALAWSLSAAVFSGTAPLVAQYLSSQLHWMLGPSLYVSLIALLTLIITKLTVNSANASLESTEPTPLKINKLTIIKL
jgi:MHS family proline/betaine transporter-like MFS transporter